MEYRKKLSFINKKRFRAFFTAFMVSLFVWVLINLSKTYVKTVQVHVLYENLSEGKLIKNKDSVLHFKLKATGFALMSSKLRELTYVIDLETHQREWKWENDNYQFSNILPKSIEVLNVAPATIHFDIQNLLKKEVPIKHQITVIPKLGYDIISFSLDNDSTLIYGDRKSIEDVSFIKTDSLFFENVTKSLSGKVNLLHVDNGVRIAEKNVGYTYTVERFTQGDFLIPIQYKNIPKDKEVTIFPKQVHIQFQSPLSLYSGYRPEAFGVFVDFNEINESNTLAVHIAHAPKGVKNVKILKKSVTYLLVEK